MICDDCRYCVFVSNDPPEYKCEWHMDDWFLTEDEDLKDYFDEEEIEEGCPKYKMVDWYGED